MEHMFIVWCIIAGILAVAVSLVIRERRIDMRAAEARRDRDSAAELRCERKLRTGEEAGELERELLLQAAEARGARVRQAHIKARRRGIVRMEIEDEEIRRREEEIRRKIEENRRRVEARRSARERARIAYPELLDAEEANAIDPFRGFSTER